MLQSNENPKEIRLFGEKSVREEAYRQKILQLEKEIARLGAFVKNPHLTHSKVEKSPPHLEGLYYESLISFDKRVKKEQKFLERRATEITERLNLQAQHLLLNIESSFRHKKRKVILAAVSATIFFLLLFVVVILLFRSSIPYLYNMESFQYKSHINQTGILNHRLSYIKTALQTQTRYHHLYEVNYIDMVNGIYAAEIELNSQPANKWFLRSICSDVISAFGKYAGGSPAEFSFLYNNKIYLKAYLTESPQKIRLQYFY